MTRDRTIDAILDEWFAEGPSRIADRVVDDALLTIQRTRQSRGALRLPRRLAMFGTLRLAAAGIAVFAVAAIAAAMLLRPFNAGVGALPSSGTPSTAPSATTAPTANPQPSPSVVVLATSGFVYPGTYRTAFDLGLTLTINHEVENGCAPGFRCRGSIDSNLPAWIYFEFGNSPPEYPPLEVSVLRVDKVVDIKHPGQLIDPPADFAGWIAKYPGMTTLAPPTAVKIGGIDATQLDVRAGTTGATFGPIPGVSDPSSGLGPGQTVRFFVLRVNGHQILITALANEHGSAHFVAAAQALQPLIDSIVWG
jgi:hypothetical protein